MVAQTKTTNVYSKDEQISPKYLENNIKNQALCSPKGNFTFTKQQIVERIKEKLDTCGTETQQFYNCATQTFHEFPTLCNNRCCTNPDCNYHRGQLFNKAHEKQILAIDSIIKEPKGWVFSDVKRPLYWFTKQYIHSRTAYLYKLLDTFSLTAFSLHTELKLYPKCYDDKLKTCRRCYNKKERMCQPGDPCPDFGKAYLHYHVISGSINKLKTVRQRWKKQITYQKAVIKDALTKYVSKYASKTPHFADETIQLEYGYLVYKIHMHRFSIKPSDIVLENDEMTPWVCLDILKYYVHGAIGRKPRKNSEWFSKNQIDKFRHCNYDDDEIKLPDPLQIHPKPQLDIETWLNEPKSVPEKRPESTKYTNIDPEELLNKIYERDFPNKPELHGTPVDEHHIEYDYPDYQIASPVPVNEPADPKPAGPNAEPKPPTQTYWIKKTDTICVAVD